jgi:hypothetical protein
MYQMYNLVPNNGLELHIPVIKCHRPREIYSGRSTNSKALIVFSSSN